MMWRNVSPVASHAGKISNVSNRKKKRRWIDMTKFRAFLKNFLFGFWFGERIEPTCSRFSFLPWMGWQEWSTEWKETWRERPPGKRRANRLPSRPFSYRRSNQLGCRGRQQPPPYNLERRTISSRKLVSFMRRIWRAVWQMARAPDISEIQTRGRGALALLAD